MEALAIVRLASSVVQFVDFGSKLCREIHEYSNTAGGAPRKVADNSVGISQTLGQQALGQQKTRYIERRLSLILTTLGEISNDGKLEVDCERATIDECTTKVKELIAVFDEVRLTPRTVESGPRGRQWFHKSLNCVEKGWKAFKILRGAEKIDALQSSLDRLLNVLTLQLQVKTNARLDSNTEAILIQLENLRLNKDQEVGLSDQPPETKPRYIIPFVRNQSFIGRKNVIGEIEQRLAAKQPRVALCGLGGVGKTQVALEYVMQLKERTTDVSIFWVYASNAGRFEEAYKRIATICDIPGHQDPNANLLQTVRNWLETTYEYRWVMVVDNVDSTTVFFQDQILGKTMAEYIPQSPNGSVLYTTRNRDIAVDLSSDRNPIHVRSMSTEEANKLLDKQIKDASTSNERAAFLEELDYLPLAITQAVACMIKRRKTIAQYLELFQKSDSTRARLLSHEFSDHWRETRALDSVAKTWMISFNLIKVEHPRAADLLSLMSFFDRHSVPQTLLIDPDEDQWDLEEAIEVLLAYYLIEVNETDSSYSMYRLVQVATCSWLAEDGERYASQALRLLAERFPDSFRKESANYLTYADRLLDPHIIRSSIPDKLRQAKLLHKTANYTCSSGHLKVAEERAQRAHAIQSNILGPMHRDTIESLSALGWVNNRLRKYTVTRSLLLEPVEKLISDPAFPLWLTSHATNILAQALISLGQSKVCVALIEKVLSSNSSTQINKRASVHSPHPVTHDDLRSYRLIVTLGRIGTTPIANSDAHHKSEANYRKALSLYEAAASNLPSENTSEEELEALQALINHGTVVATEGLALVLSYRGQDEESEAMFRSVLVERESRYGPRNLMTMVSLHHLAGSLGNQERWEEAEEVWGRVRRDSEMYLGADHGETKSIKEHYEQFLERRRRLEMKSEGGGTEKENCGPEKPS